MVLFSSGAEVAVEPPAKTGTDLPRSLRVEFDREPAEARSVKDRRLIKNGVFSDPSVLLENDRYRMWFTSVTRAGSRNQEMGTAYAESDDGITWQPRLKSDGDPDLVLRPAKGGWDEGGVEAPSVVRAPDGKYLLLYTGDLPPKGSHAWAIGLAVSSGGLEWTKVGNGPVFEGGGGWEGPFTEGRKKIGGVSEASVLYDAGEKKFKMWYSGLGMIGSKIAFRVGYATSPDCRTWTRRDKPVFEPGPDGSWDDAVTSHINVARDTKGGYHMFYFGTSAERYAYSEKHGSAMITGAIGHAYSTDGINWKRDANPVVNIKPGSWRAWMVGGPSALIVGDEVRLWYFASAVHNKYEFTLAHARTRLGSK